MENENNETKRDLTMLSNRLAIIDSEYVRLVSLISDTWEKAKGKAALAVNTEHLRTFPAGSPRKNERIRIF